MDNPYSEDENESVKIPPEFLLCSGCGRVATGTRIFQCEIGHLICRGCHSNSNETDHHECSTCKSKITKTRNFVAEKLVRKLFKGCKYCKEVMHGCQFVLSQEDMEPHHRSTCQFRPIACQLMKSTDNSICGAELGVDFYMFHVLYKHSVLKHPIEFTTEEIGGDSVTTASAKIQQIIPFDISQNREINWNNIPPVQSLASSGESFLLVTEIVNCSMIWWLYYVGNGVKVPRNGNISATITIENPISKLTTSFTGPVHSIRKTIPEIINSGICLTVNRNTLKALSHFNHVTNCTEWIVGVTVIKTQTASSESMTTNSPQPQKNVILAGKNANFGQKILSSDFSVEGATKEYQRIEERYDRDTLLHFRNNKNWWNEHIYYINAKVPQAVRDSRDSHLLNKNSPRIGPRCPIIPKHKGQGDGNWRTEKVNMPSENVVTCVPCVPELNKSDDPFKPFTSISTRRARLNSLNQEQSMDDEIIRDELTRKMRGILNRLSSTNIDKSVTAILELNLEDQADKIPLVVFIIFERAINEPFFSPHYAHLLKMVCDRSVRTASIFRNRIVTLCQKEFEKESTVEDEIKALEQTLLTTEEDKKATIKLELEKLKNLSAERSLGNVRFIGELYNTQILTYGVMFRIIDILLARGDVGSYNSLCTLLITSGKRLDQQLIGPPAKTEATTVSNQTVKSSPPNILMSMAFNKLKILSLDKNLPPRTRFALSDLVTLRESGWVAGQCANNLSTVTNENIHPVDPPPPQTNVNMNTSNPNPTPWKSTRQSMTALDDNQQLIAEPTSVDPKKSVNLRNFVRNVVKEFSCSKNRDNFLNYIPTRFPEHTTVFEFVTEVSKQVCELSRENLEKVAGALVKGLVNIGQIPKTETMRVFTEGLLTALSKPNADTPRVMYSFAGFLVEALIDESNLSWLISLRDKMKAESVDVGAKWKKLACKVLKVLSERVSVGRVRTMYKLTPDSDRLPNMPWLSHLRANLTTSISKSMSALPVVHQMGSYSPPDIELRSQPKPQDLKNLVAGVPSSNLYEWDGPFTPITSNSVRVRLSQEESMDEEISTDEIVERMRVILNELTPNNIDKSVIDILDLNLEGREDKIRFVVYIIFEKAISDPALSPNYANLLKMICSRSRSQWAARITREHILYQCQKELRKGSMEEAQIKTLEQTLATTYKKQRAPIKLELEKLKQLSAERSLGNVGLMGELYNIQMFSAQLMIDSINTLLGNGDAESYISLCILLSTIGKKLDQELSELQANPETTSVFGQTATYSPPPPKDFMCLTFSKLKILSMDKKLLPRARCALSDLLTLRESGWLPVRFGNDVSTATNAKIHPGDPQQNNSQFQGKTVGNNAGSLSQASVSMNPSNPNPTTRKIIKLRMTTAGADQQGSLSGSSTSISTQSPRDVDVLGQPKPQTKCPNSDIHLATEAAGDVHAAVGICIVRAVGSRPISYQYGPNEVEHSEGKSLIEYQVENALFAIKYFQKKFTKTTKLFIKCSSDLTKEGKNKLFTFKLHEELEKLVLSNIIREYTVRVAFKRRKPSVTGAALCLLSNDAPKCKAMLNKLM